MIDEIKEEFKKDFGAEPLIPKNSIVFDNKLFQVSEALKDAKLKIKPVSKGLLLYNNYATQAFLDYNKKRLKNYMILNEKSSFLLTCGRRVFLKGIIEKKGNSGVYAAFNENREVLGVVKYKDKKYTNAVSIGCYMNQDRLKRVIF